MGGDEQHPGAREQLGRRTEAVLRVEHEGRQQRRAGQIVAQRQHMHPVVDVQLAAGVDQRVVAKVIDRARRSLPRRRSRRCRPLRGPTSAPARRNSSPRRSLKRPNSERPGTRRSCRTASRASAAARSRRPDSRRRCVQPPAGPYRPAGLNTKRSCGSLIPGKPRPPPFQGGAKAFIDFGVRDDQGRRHPDHIRPGQQDHQPLARRPAAITSLARARVLGLELPAEPQTAVAQLLEGGIALRDRRDAARDPLGAKLHAAQHFRRIDDLEHPGAGPRRRADYRRRSCRARRPRNVWPDRPSSSIAPIGMPPPRPLAVVRMSGATPYCS